MLVIDPYNLNQENQTISITYDTNAMDPKTVTWTTGSFFTPLGATIEDISYVNLFELIEADMLSEGITASFDLNPTTGLISLGTSEAIKFQPNNEFTTKLFGNLPNTGSYLTARTSSYIPWFVWKATEECPIQEKLNFEDQVLVKESLTDDGHVAASSNEDGFIYLSNIEGNYNRVAWTFAYEPKENVFSDFSGSNPYTYQKHIEHVRSYRPFVIFNSTTESYVDYSVRRGTFKHVAKKSNFVNKPSFESYDAQWNVDFEAHLLSRGTDYGRFNPGQPAESTFDANDIDGAILWLAGDKGIATQNHLGDNIVVTWNNLVNPNHRMKQWNNFHAPTLQTVNGNAFLDFSNESNKRHSKTMYQEGEHLNLSQSYTATQFFVLKSPMSVVNNIISWQSKGWPSSSNNSVLYFGTAANIVGNYSGLIATESLTFPNPANAHPIDEVFILEIEHTPYSGSVVKSFKINGTELNPPVPLGSLSGVPFTDMNAEATLGKWYNISNVRSLWTNCEYDFDANYGVQTSGGRVTAWTSSIGNFIVNQNTGSMQPFYVSSSEKVNDYPVIFFSKSLGTCLQSTTLAPTSSKKTIYVVGHDWENYINGNSERLYQCGGVSASGSYLTFMGNQQFNTRFNFGGLALQRSIDVTRSFAESQSLDPWKNNLIIHAVSMDVQETASYQMQHYLHGFRTMNSIATSFVSGTLGNNKLSIGSDIVFSTNSALSGSIARLISFNVEHTPEQVRQVTEYLQYMYQPRVNIEELFENCIADYDSRNVLTSSGRVERWYNNSTHSNAISDFIQSTSSIQPFYFTNYSSTSMPAVHFSRSLKTGLILENPSNWDLQTSSLYICGENDWNALDDSPRRLFQTNTDNQNLYNIVEISWFNTSANNEIWRCATITGSLFRTKSCYDLKTLSNPTDLKLGFCSFKFGGPDRNVFPDITFRSRQVVGYDQDNATSVSASDPGSHWRLGNVNPGEQAVAFSGSLYRVLLFNEPHDLSKQLTLHDYFREAYQKPNSNDSYFFSGSIGEVMTYNRLLNQTEKNQIYSYLRTKYNI